MSCGEDRRVPSQQQPGHHDQFTNRIEESIPFGGVLRTGSLRSFIVGTSRIYLWLGDSISTATGSPSTCILTDFSNRMIGLSLLAAG